MISRTGTILTTGERHLRVTFDLANACSTCAEGAGCGIVPIARFLQRSDCATIDLPRLDSTNLPEREADNLRPGDRVHVAIDGGRFLWLVTVGYVLPLLGFAGGALLAQGFYPSGGDVAAVIGAFGGAASVFALRIMSRSADRPIAWLNVRVRRAEL